MPVLTPRPSAPLRFAAGQPLNERLRRQIAELRRTLDEARAGTEAVPPDLAAQAQAKIAAARQQKGRVPLTPAALGHVRQFFGRAIDPHDFLQAATVNPERHHVDVALTRQPRSLDTHRGGAFFDPPDGDKLDEYGEWDRSPVLLVQAHAPAFGEAEPGNAHSFASRAFFRDRDGRVRVYNNYLALGRYGHAEAKGRELVRAQVEALRRLGARSIHAFLEYNPDVDEFEVPKKGVAHPDPENDRHWERAGYLGGYVFPLHLGFGGTLDHDVLSQIPPAISRKMPDDDIRSLLDQPEGKRWWLENYRRFGGSNAIHDGYLDLDPQSRTGRAHELAWAAYQQQKTSPLTKENQSEPVPRRRGQPRRGVGAAVAPRTRVPATDPTPEPPKTPGPPVPFARAGTAARTPRAAGDPETPGWERGLHAGRPELTEPPPAGWPTSGTGIEGPALHQAPRDDEARLPIRARDLRRGVDDLIAGTRLAYHLKSIERRHAGAEAGRLATLALQGHSRDEGGRDVYAALGHELRRAGDEAGDAYRWEHINNGLRLDRAVARHFNSPAFDAALAPHLRGGTKEQFAKKLGTLLTTDWDARQLDVDTIDDADRRHVAQARLNKDRQMLGHAFVGETVAALNALVRRAGVRGQVTPAVLGRSLLRHAFRAEDREELAGGHSRGGFAPLPVAVGPASAAKRQWNPERFRRDVRADDPFAGQSVVECVAEAVSRTEAGRPVTAVQVALERREAAERFQMARPRLIQPGLPAASSPFNDPLGLPVQVEAVFDHFGRNNANRFEEALRCARAGEAFAPHNKAAAGLPELHALAMFGAALLIAGKRRRAGLPVALVTTPLGQHILEKLKGYGQSLLRDKHGNVIAAGPEEIIEAAKDLDRRRSSSSPNAD
jgi:hypothetical protein